MQEYIPQLERASTPLVGAKASAFVRPRLFVCIVRVFVLHCSVCSVFVRSCFFVLVSISCNVNQTGIVHHFVHFSLWCVRWIVYYSSARHSVSALVR